MNAQDTTVSQLAALTNELHVLIQTAAPANDHSTAMTLVTNADRLLRELLKLRNAGGYFADVLASFPRCQSEVERLAAGQQHLLRELESLQSLAENIGDDAPDSATEFSAMWSRWVSHLTTHEYLEGRLLQTSYGTDIGGEA